MNMTVLSWTRSTWVGWVLGIPSVIVLALVGEVLHIGGSQFLVGAGMGCGLGLMQGRAVRRVGLRAIPWFWSCTAGLAAPFLVFDVAHWIGAAWPYSLLLCVAVGGVIAAAWQTVLLRPHFDRAGWWIPGSALGWSLAGAAATRADSLIKSHSLRGLPGAGTYLGLVALAGLVLGVVTGLVLVHGLRPKRSGETG